MVEIRDLDGKVLATGDSVKAILAEETSSRVPASRRKSFKRADLRNLDLQDAAIWASGDVKSTRRSDFMEADFSGSNLQGAQLCGLDLRGARFDGCDMRRAFHIVLCDMTGARFHDCDIGAFTSADRCGYYSSLSRGIWDNVTFTACDMQQVMFGASSAKGMFLKDCNLEDANFDGDFDGAIFSRCNLEDANPGTFAVGAEGARFGVSTYVCNVKDLFLDGCPTVPTEIPERDVPDVPADFVWVGDDDHYLRASKAANADERKRIMALWETEHLRIQAEQAARSAAARAETDALIAKARAKEATYSTWGSQDSQTTADRVKKAVRAAAKVADLPPLTGTFDAVPVAFVDGLHRMRITFNRALRVGWRTVLVGFTVTGGRITRVRRVDGRSDYWELFVRPDGADPIVIATTDSLIGSGGQSIATPATVTIP